MPHLGIQTDEALFVAGIYQTNAAYYKIRLFHHFIPLMLSSYIGTLKSLIYAGLFQIFTPSPYSTRIPVLLIGVATIWLFFLLLRKVSGTAAATAGCLLLATDTIFLLTDDIRLGTGGPGAPAACGWHAASLPVLRDAKTFGCRLGVLSVRPGNVGQSDLHLVAGGPGGGIAGGIPANPVAAGDAQGGCRGGGGLPLGRRSAGEVQPADQGGDFPQQRGLVDAWTFRASWRCSQAPSRAATSSATWFGKIMTALPRWRPGTPLAKASERVSAMFGHPRRNLMLAALGGALLLVPLLWRARTRGAAHHPFRRWYFCWRHGWPWRSTRTPADRCTTSYCFGRSRTCWWPWPSAKPRRSSAVPEGPRWR